MKLEFLNLQEKYIKAVDEKLSELIISTDDEYDIVKNAMLYSLKAGGKRLRPILAIAFCEANGGSLNDALPFACAIEMIHCYSLIHDDLPCMDNDDMRRGKPSCHKKFGEANALLAGDALLTLAFDTIATSEFAKKNPENALKAIAILSDLSGIEGMVLGQVMDLTNEGKSINGATLINTYAKKTSALICAAVSMGCLSGGLSDKSAFVNAQTYALELGLAFQIIDDILDVTSDEQTLGKPIGSDVANEKVTCVRLFGLDGAKKLAQHHTEASVAALLKTPHSDFLLELTNSLLNREK